MDQLLVALDVDSSDRAFELTDQLRDVAGGFKIGSRLFCTEGPQLVRDLVSSGHRIFLDLKYHDIPTTVATAVRAASELGVWMVTVHASGGHDMLVAAKEAAARVEGGPKVVAVTVLTSFDDRNLHSLGVSRSVRQQVESLAQLSKSAGIDGVVASPLEIELIRKVCGDEFIVVTPGIRNPTTDKLNDQKRTMDATSAIQAGASYLVVGRPITAAVDPLNAALDIRQQISRHG
jgi:orotidine-5'-phosphate decarboxylase